MQMNNQLVAGKNTQGGRFQPVIGDKTVARRAFANLGLLVSQVQAKFQNTVMTAQLRRICYNRSFGGAWACLGRNLPPSCTSNRRKKYQSKSERPTPENRTRKIVSS